MTEEKDPQSRLKQLSATAVSFGVDSNIPIRRYYRSGNEIIKMAQTYMKEENLEAAYVLYMKYLTLFVDKISQHRDYKEVLPSEKKKTMATVRQTMPITEHLKDTLKIRYEKEYEEWLQEQTRFAEEAEARRKEEERRRVELAREEKEKLLAIERDREVALWHQAQIDKELEMNSTVQPQTDVLSRPSTSGATARNISPVSPVDEPSFFSETPKFDRAKKPSTEPITQPEPKRPSFESSAPAMPSVPDRSTKPMLSDGASAGGLRTIVVPKSFMREFLILAEPNTARGIETCGVLGGRLANNKFVVTNLVVPKQSGTPDSCDMTDEIELLEYMDTEDLLMLGWIHTHPTQTAFLSSVDLHSHYPYQAMLPEAIAIVCSPKYDETGFFSLTRDHGMQEIGSCRLEGFHPHPKEPPLFEEGQHVQLDGGAATVVKDMRT